MLIPISSSSSSSHSSLSNNAYTHSPRRIRFAPLPDPRRAVFITDSGDELPLPQHDFSSSSFPDPDVSSISSSSDSKRNSYSTDPSSVASLLGSITPPSLSPQDPPSPTVSSIVLPQSSTTTPKQKKSFLHAFRKSSSGSSSPSSSQSLTPTPSLDRGASNNSRKSTGITTEEILTLGTIHLFRASSRDRSDDASGWGLTRWSSATSTQKSSPLAGSPLARTQSSQSYRSKPSRFFNSTTPQPTPASQNGTRKVIRKGTRMLNGRVYGAPKRNPNLFASARDEEPEFVEWGYGGMGSVKGAKSAGVGGNGMRWERLHGAGAGGAASNDADDDDGSGMGWVKRRREKKEREEKEHREKEEKEQQEKLALSRSSTPASTITVPAPTCKTPVPGSDDDLQHLHVTDNPSVPSGTPTADTTISPTSTSLNTTASATIPTTAPTAIPAPHSQPPSLSKDEEHFLRAVTVPAPLRHHHRSHSYSSREDVPVNTHEVSESSSEDDDDELNPRVGNLGDEEDDDEDDDEDESEEEEEARRTALGAGVEKVSLHKGKEGGGGGD